MSIDFRQLSEHLERIYSRRLALRPVCLADAWPLYEATRNPSFNKHLLWSRPESEEEILQRVDAISVASRLGRMVALSAVLKKTGEWVSLYRFQPYRQDPLAMEMGVWTHDRFWHGRYSLELVRLCIDAAFVSSDVERLVGSAKPDNRTSCHLMQMVGMAPSELLTRETESGDFVVAQEFTVTRSAWLARTGAEPSFSAFRGRADDWDRRPTGGRAVAPALPSRAAEEELMAA